VLSNQLKIAVALGVLLCSSSAIACISLPPDPEKAARGTVLIGYVTGENYPDYEAALIRDGNSQYPRNGRHIVRVTPIESIHGELLGPIDIETPCYSGMPRVGERAIVIRAYGEEYVLPSDGNADYEKALRVAAAKLKKR
jgi:hypothetical protein